MREVLVKLSREEFLQKLGNTDTNLANFNDKVVSPSFFLNEHLTNDVGTILGRQQFLDIFNGEIVLEKYTHANGYIDPVTYAYCHWADESPRVVSLSPENQIPLEVELSISAADDPRNVSIKGVNFKLVGAPPAIFLQRKRFNEFFPEVTPPEFVPATGGGEYIISEDGTGGFGWADY